MTPLVTEYQASKGLMKMRRPGAPTSKTFLRASRSGRAGNAALVALMLGQCSDFLPVATQSQAQAGPAGATQRHVSH